MASLWKDPPALQWVEFFAGKAEATRKFKEAGYHVGRLDINYMEAEVNCMNPMDLLSDAGFGFLGCMYFRTHTAKQIQTALHCSCQYFSLTTNGSKWMNLGK